MGNIDSYTKLLLHCDGSDGSTTFVDSSFSGKSITAVGNAQIDTAQYKFGGASGLFDGDGDYLSVPDSDDWYFGTGAFTVDFWVRFNSLPSSGAAQFLYNQRQSTNDAIEINLTNNSGTYQWIFKVTSGGGAIITLTCNTTISASTWYHIALTRNGNDFKFFQNGAQIGSTLTDTDAVPNLSASIDIGRWSGNGYYFNGWLDEFRISKGIARWTSDFTPPTRPYTRSQAAFLLNMV